MAAGIDQCFPRHGVEAVDFRAMGCPCRIQADSPAAVTAAQAVVLRLEARYSRYLPDSETSRINRSAGKPGGIVVDDETAELLNFAAAAHAQSHGRFDITAGVLRRGWDFRSGAVPDREAVDQCLQQVGWQRVRWQPPVLELPAGAELDFGGFVKEYAADAAAAAARAAGGAHGLVDLGGDLAVIGPNPDGSPWRVGIRDPFAPDQAVATIELASGGLASSGNYARAIRTEQRVYGHVLDPRTGWPPESGFAGVSARADSCLLAGIATTVAMVSGVDDGQAWLAGLGLPFVAVTAQRQVVFGGDPG